MLAFIQSNVQALKIPQLKVVRQDVFRFIHQCPNQFDFIFAGPPYALSEIDDLPRLILSKPLLKPHGLFILEHTPRNDYQTFEGFEKMRNYGTTVFSFFSLPEKKED
jgi:16S rRNA G966 N2-methylase RsmD